MMKMEIMIGKIIQKTIIILMKERNLKGGMIEAGVEVEAEVKEEEDQKEILIIIIIIEIIMILGIMIMMNGEKIIKKMIIINKIMMDGEMRKGKEVEVKLIMILKNGK